MTSNNIKTIDHVQEILLSVIIPVYNVDKFLRVCIQSIVSDEICLSGQVEVLLIDDGSSDDSGRIADEFASKYGYIKVIHQHNQGVAAARNVGIREAKGKWLYFVDSDDWLAEHALTVVCEKCRQHQKADILLFDAYQDTAKGEKNWEHFFQEKHWKEHHIINHLQRGTLYFPAVNFDMEKTKVPLAAPWDKVYHKDFVRCYNLKFRDDLCVLDDMVFNMEAFGEANDIIYLKDKIYHYRYVSESITNSYKVDRIEKDLAVWKYIQNYIDYRSKMNYWTDHEKIQLMQAFYCRIIKSFSICCRLQFFNASNKKNLPEKIKYVKNILKSSPYQEAFCNVKLKNLEWKLKVMAIVGKRNCGLGVYILHLAENTFLSDRL